MSSETNFSDLKAVPSFGLKFQFDKKFPNPHTQNLKPTWKQTFDLIPMMLRYIPYYYKQAGPVLMDYFSMQNSKMIYGAPLGGIGSGSIGRGFAGEFCRYALTPGIYQYNTVNQNQFVINIRDKNNKTLFQSLLSTFSRPKGSNSAWESNLDPSKCSYTALYPRSWSEFGLEEYGIKLICRQISPFIPHNYKDSSLPCAVFVFEVENCCDEERHVSISFVMKNGTGSKKDSAGAPKTEVFESENAEGAKISQIIAGMPCDYYIGVGKSEEISISKVSKIDPNGNGSALWNDLKENGILTEKSEDKNLKEGKDVCVAVSSKIQLTPQQSQKIDFAFAWDAPKVKFPKSDKIYSKYYTNYFDSGLKLFDYAIKSYPEWEKSIAEWQKEVLEDEALPDWFKGAVFNEMYFIADGGSLWLKVDDDEKIEANDHRRVFGRFLYLEGHEYRMYNTYDVHFYASAALMSLFPNLEISLQYDFRDSIVSEHPEQRKMLYDGKMCARKVKNSTPHDLGEPINNPMELVNSYPIHDVSDWKDLNSKFILQIYRDFTVLQDLESIETDKRNKCISIEFIDKDDEVDYASESQNKGKGQKSASNYIGRGDEKENRINSMKFLKDFYPVLKILVEKTLEFDTDNDGLIENSNAPDQTFDTWVMSGPSAYCSGLFLASLQVMSEISNILNDHDSSMNYKNILEKGKISLQEKLWNGKYYSFDTSVSTTIMSDQLCGHWYLKLSGFSGYEVFPKENVQIALQTILENNVKKFCNGEKGMVNGWIPDQGVDKTSMQSEEVWIGVNWAVASTMIYEGMLKEAFEFSGELYKTITEKVGLAFETPEALYEKNIYRSIGYMRCLSIYSMLIAYQREKASK